MYKHLASRHRETMQYLEETYGLTDIKKHPGAYVHCLESKAAYHAYMCLHWEYQIGKPGANQAAAIRNRDRYRRNQEKVFKELHAYNAASNK
jgi:hypothetical protein